MSRWDEDDLLGRLPDQVLADLRGVTRQTVSSARRFRGLTQPKKEAHGPLLNCAIRQALMNRFEAKSAQEVYFSVLNSYGAVSQREVQRRIVTLLEEGELEVNYEREYTLTAKGQAKPGLWRKSA